MSDKNEYKQLISDIIEKQAAILGPEIAMIKARQVAGLKVDKSGKVTDISGSEDTVLQELVDKYIELSGQIVRNVLNPVFEKYPSIKVKLK